MVTILFTQRPQDKTRIDNIIVYLVTMLAEPQQGETRRVQANISSMFWINTSDEEI